MASTLENFSSSTTAASDDWLVGYDTAVLNGERRWQLLTIANAVSGIIRQEMANHMKNTLTLGNYPYLEYAWVGAPNAAPQSIPQDVETVVDLNTEIADLGGHGVLNDSFNQITLQPGTYLFTIYCPIVLDSTTSTQPACILSLKNTNGTYVTRKLVGATYTEIDSISIDTTQMTITTPSTFEIRVLPHNNTVIGRLPIDSGFPASPSNGNQRTTIKLWKVG